MNNGEEDVRRASAHPKEPTGLSLEPWVRDVREVFLPRVEHRAEVLRSHTHQGATVGG